MNLFELFVKIGVKDEASKNLSSITSKLGNGLKTAAKIGTAAVTAASTAVVALTKNAVENFAEYEQLVGGVDTLFKESSQKLQNYAKEAYKTAGMSANEYMATATGFSASLLQSLAGDTAEAADYADRAIRDMSDNANKMGTDMELIKNALTFRAA
jgi:gamma-glutamyl:cysteine ligase YbdK (ATP-grasp superfamily)